MQDVHKAIKALQVRGGGGRAVASPAPAARQRHPKAFAVPPPAAAAPTDAPAAPAPRLRRRRPSGALVRAVDRLRGALESRGAEDANGEASDEERRAASISPVRELRPPPPLMRASPPATRAAEMAATRPQHVPRRPGARVAIQPARRDFMAFEDWTAPSAAEPFEEAGAAAAGVLARRG